MIDNLEQDLVAGLQEDAAEIRFDNAIMVAAAAGYRRRVARRRAMYAFGVFAVVGVVGAVAAVLAVGQPGQPPVTGHRSPAVVASQAGQRMDLASFALDRTAEGTITVTFKEAAADPEALEKALANVGITALVRVNQMCIGTGTGVIMPDGAVKYGRSGDSPTLTFNATALPKTVTLSLSLLVDDRKFVTALRVGNSVTGSTVTCTPLTAGNPAQTR